MVARKINADDTVRVYMCTRCGHLGVSFALHVPTCACGNADVDWMVMGLPILQHDIEHVRDKLLKRKEAEP